MPSEAVNPTAASVVTSHAEAATAAVRSAASPSTSSRPAGCPGTRNVASSNEPTQTTAAVVASTRMTMMPERVTSPGSGRPPGDHHGPCVRMTRRTAIVAAHAAPARTNVLVRGPGMGDMCGYYP